MRRWRLVLLVLVVAAASCGGDDDSNDDNTGGNGSSCDNEEVVGGDPGFSLSDLPGDFPEFVPPEWDTGAYTEATGFPTASFESSMSFQEAIDHYNDVYGVEGTVVGNDPGERLAQWTRTPPWVISVFEGDPVIIGISRVED